MCVRHGHLSATVGHLLLCLELMLLLLLKRRGASFEQCSFDRPGCIGGENRPRVLRSGHWLFPRFQHFIQLPACLLVDQEIRIHKDIKEITAEEEGVWRANVLYHGIEDVQCWEFAIWGCLPKELAISSTIVRYFMQ